MNLSSDMQTAFSEHIREKEVKLDTDLTVQVLTTATSSSSSSSVT